MTSEKPNKPGWYIYSKCFNEEAKEAIYSAPYGIILVVYSDFIFITFNVKRELLSISPWTKRVVPVSELSGLFSEEPIDILGMIERGN